VGGRDFGRSGFEKLVSSAILQFELDSYGELTFRLICWMQVLVMVMLNEERDYFVTSITEVGLFPIQECSVHILGFGSMLTQESFY
jgi:hypothetical protein